jgi:hypothetical protein
MRSEDCPVSLVSFNMVSFINSQREHSHSILSYLAEIGFFCPPLSSLSARRSRGRTGKILSLKLQPRTKLQELKGLSYNLQAIVEIGSSDQGNHRRCRRDRPCLCRMRDRWPA